MGDPREVLLAAQEIEVMKPRARYTGFERVSSVDEKEIEWSSL